MAKFLDERGAWWWGKTGPYNLLFLFSIGIDSKTRAMGLLGMDRRISNAPTIPTCAPQKYVAGSVCGRSDFYRNMRIQIWAQGIHKPIRQHDLPGYAAGVRVLPEMIRPSTSPAAPYSKARWKPWRSINCRGALPLNMILPYPPRSAVDARRDHATESGRARFSLMPASIGQHYPGFETDIHGAKRNKDGEKVPCT